MSRLYCETGVLSTGLKGHWAASWSWMGLCMWDKSACVESCIRFDSSFCKNTSPDSVCP